VDVLPASAAGGNAAAGGIGTAGSSDNLGRLHSLGGVVFAVRLNVAFKFFSCSASLKFEDLVDS
jgi:hypothetical protein